MESTSNQIIPRTPRANKQKRWRTLAPPDLTVPRETAIWYIHHMEWLVVPADGKLPSVKWNYNDLPCLVTDEAIARFEYPYVDIALLTGDRSRVIVGDCDPRHGGDIEDFFRLGWPRQTPIVETPNGGWHIYLACGPEGLPSIRQYGEGLEVKGNGAIAIMPPSHNTTVWRHYRWWEGHEPWNMPLADVPDAVAEEIRLHATGGQTARMTPDQMLMMREWRDVGLTREQVRKVALKRYRKALIKVRVDGEGRNNTMFWLARQLQSLGMPAASILRWVEAFGETVKNG